MTEFLPNTEGVFYNVPASVYHKAPGTSQSTLKAFDDAGSPRHFKEVPRKPSTPDMQFGTLVHAAVLEPHSWTDLFFIRPDTYEAEVMVCPKCNSVSDDSKTCRKCKTDRVKATTQKEWFNGADVCRQWMEKASSRIVVDKETHARVSNCAAALRERTGLFSKALGAKNSRREVSYFKRDEETGLLLKARVDLEVIDTSGQVVLFDPKK